ncbi:cytochrome P450 [Amycolatopsis regifaucium]|uniref:Cytochrome n=1 Tax=Amycolatopsis regifaucium TaxID=546365 RepID=A0A154MQS9_9PSEU|nr:cytochrome P450 [Amycolatopsis regifaucium]KZB85799.1 cytochrome [Amycolatopsis regifaucium]OKA10446.1 cytochrome [Amycolatopsis regifaucium]SFI77326.1 Cytochrome P450 [Amycolatopsis regifaucium]
MLPDPFAATTRGVSEPDPVRPALRAAGRLVEVAAPAGGSAWIVTEEKLAREVLSHPAIVKNPATAPELWDPVRAGLEQTAAEQPSLTTLDGPDHTRLRRAHAPLLSARRIQARSGRIHEIARELLTDLGEGTVDLMDGFSTRFPLTVLLDLLDIPLGLLDAAVDACRRMSSPEPGGQGKAIAAIAKLATAGLTPGRHGLATELHDRVPPETTEDDLRYHLFALIFAGQLTTDASIGFLVARLLDGDTAPEDDLVRETLRDHPPAPFTLWRFTTTELDLAGTRLPARSPVLVDIQGINTDPSRAPGPDLTFGAGPHFCIGAQLAQLELRAVASVLRAEFPRARLAVPYAELRQTFLGGIQGTRLTGLPVLLHG